MPAGTPDVKVGAALHTGFAAGLNDLLIITACVALAEAVCSLPLIRSRDFRLAPWAWPARAGSSEHSGRRSRWAKG